MGRIYFVFTSIVLFVDTAAMSSSVISTPASILMQRAACSTQVNNTSCVISISNFNVILDLTSEKCQVANNILGSRIKCLSEIRKLSDYIGMVNKFETNRTCHSTSRTEAEQEFPWTDNGLVLLYFMGMLTGVPLTSFIFLLYIKFSQQLSEKQDNTYLDLSDENEVRPVEHKQRGSVAFVREIASVYYSQPEIEKDRSSSSRNSLFSWTSRSRKSSVPERQSSLNKVTSDKAISKQMFAYEQPVPEELHDYLDLDSPTTPTEEFQYGNGPIDITKDTSEIRDKENAKDVSSEDKKDNEA